jgi:hypothetical protein
MSQDQRKLKNFLIFCEEKGCHWKAEIRPDEVYAWRNKPCPKCGKGIMVSDDDVAGFELLLKGDSGSSGGSKNAS